MTQVYSFLNFLQNIIQNMDGIEEMSADWINRTEQINKNKPVRKNKIGQKRGSFSNRSSEVSTNSKKEDLVIQKLSTFGKANNRSSEVSTNWKKEDLAIQKPSAFGKANKRSSEVSINLKKEDAVIQKPSAFSKANWDYSLKKRNKETNQYYKDKQIGMGVDLDHFKIYGPGIYLFFSFLKSLCYIFLVMAIISLIPSLYNYFAGNNQFNMSSSINIYFTKTTIANYDSTASNYRTQNKLFNSIPSLLSVVLFIVYLFYWLHKSNCLIQGLQSQTKLKSYSVVQMLNPPKEANQQNVTAFMNQFGKVVEVATVKNYDQTIYLSKKIYEIELKIEQLEKEKTQNYEGNKQIEQLKKQVDNLYRDLVQQESDKKEEIIKFFIVFSRIEERKSALMNIQPYLRTFCNCNKDQIPENYLFFGQSVDLQACHTEPGEIIWQNQHIVWKTRWIRTLLQFFFLLLAILLGFIFISLLNILTPSTQSQYIDTSMYSSSTIQSVTNGTITKSWCLQNAINIISSDAAILSLCSSHVNDYYIKIAIGVGISISILVIKYLLKMFVIFLAKFQRYKSQSEQSKDIIKNLFLTYISTTFLIILLLQAQIGYLSLKNVVSIFLPNNYLLDNLNNLSSYADFTSGWYRDIGYQIFLVWIVMVIHPSITMPLFDHLLQKIQFYKAQKEQIQANMDKMIQAPQFQIEDHYANILMIVFVSLFFSGGMPIMLVVGFFAILFRYLYFKYHFIRFCKTPKVFDESLDLYVTNMLIYAVLLHFMISIWMYGVTGIFTDEKAQFLTDIINSENILVRSIGGIVDRIFVTWYYSCFFVLFIVIVIFKMLIYNLLVKNFISKTNKQPFQNKTEVEQIFDQSYLDICASYKLQNNPYYKQIFSIMIKKRKFILKVKRDSRFTQMKNN